MRTPRRSTARASPRTSRRGLDRAQCGVYDAPEHPVAPTQRADASSAAQEPAVGPGPRAAAPGVRASVTVPPFTQSQAMPSSAAALPTSSTVSRMAAPIASAAARPWRRVSAASLAGNSAEHQPPLRPLAPNPAICRSTTTHPQPGVGAQQVVGGPQPGEARADDGDVRPSTSPSSGGRGRQVVAVGDDLVHPEDAR